MTTPRDVIEEKLLVCEKIQKRKHLLTDEEYQVLKECRTSELFRVESNTRRLGKICEGEKRQLAAFYDEQEAKYRRAVTKLNRRVLPKPPRGGVPPRRPIVRPIERTPPPVSTSQDTTVIRLTDATRSTGMDMDAAIDARATVSPDTPAPDVYQLEEQIPVSVVRSDLELLLEGLEDDNFGNAEGDGMRDFLEMCTGTALPPMELGDDSSLKLLQSQLPSMHRPTLPVVDNFQELNIDAVLSQLDLQGTTRTNASTPAQLIPPLPFEAFGGDSLDNVQHLPAFESVPVVQSPPPEAPTERSQYVPAEDGAPLEPVEEAAPPRPARAVRRQPRTFTNRLPLLENALGLPRNRNTFDIFSCYYDSNVDWMIESLQNRLFEQRVASPLQPQPLLTTDLSAIQPYDSMSIDAQRRITDSDVARNVSDWSRENPRPLSFADRTDPHGRSSKLHDAARARLIDSLETPPVGVASIVAPESLPPLLLLPPLQDDPLPAQPYAMEQPIFPAVPGEEMTPRTHVLTRTIEEPRLEDAALAQLPANNVTTCEEQEPLDYMLVGILLAVQLEMSKLRSITHQVPVHQLKKVFGINTRSGEAKLFKNILLLKHARLVETRLYENQSMKSISIIFPVSAAN